MRPVWLSLQWRVLYSHRNLIGNQPWGKISYWIVAPRCRRQMPPLTLHPIFRLTKFQLRPCASHKSTLSRHAENSKEGEHSMSFCILERFHNACGLVVGSESVVCVWIGAIPLLNPILVLALCLTCPRWKWRDNMYQKFKWSIQMIYTRCTYTLCIRHRRKMSPSPYDVVARKILAVTTNPHPLFRSQNMMWCESRQRRRGKQDDPEPNTRQGGFPAWCQIEWENTIALTEERASTVEALRFFGELDQYVSSYCQQNFVWGRPTKRQSELYRTAFCELSQLAAAAWHKAAGLVHQ